jgi:hypothetical protein
MLTYFFIACGVAACSLFAGCGAPAGVPGCFKLIPIVIYLRKTIGVLRTGGIVERSVEAVVHECIANLIEAN